MRIVVAPQEYKGTLTAEEAAAAIADGVRRAIPECDIDEIPLADGGPGTVRAMVRATGGEFRTTNVRGPMSWKVDAEWGLLPDGTAVIEMAAAAGLVLVPEEQRNPLIATTYGVGELIRAALDAGSRRIIVGLGGSATNDGGAGMAQALGAKLLDSRARQLALGGEALLELANIDTSGLDDRLAVTTVIGATDVRNPLLGPGGATYVYGPQKGASEEDVPELEAALQNYADVIERDLGIRVHDVPGAGAAGGLGAGLIAFLGAELRPGFELVAKTVHLRQRIRGAELVITGEGRLDEQTQYGKTVRGVATMAREEGVAVIAVPGALGEGWESIQMLFEAIEPAGKAPTPASALADSVERVLRARQPGRTA
jgi:glycerate kinase